MSDAATASHPLAEAFVSGRPALGAWAGLPTAMSCEVMSRAGFDYVCIDMQHGLADYSDALAMLAAIDLGTATPVVRVPWNEQGIIGRVLDAGALGVIIPMVETAEQCESIVRAAKFPPRGNRSATGLRTAYHAGHSYFDYTENANAQILTVVMVETPRGVRNVREMMAVPDVDCVLIGPYDLERAVGAESLGGQPTREFRPSEEAEALVREVLKASGETGVAAGYVTNSPSEA